MYQYSDEEWEAWLGWWIDHRIEDGHGWYKFVHGRWVRYSVHFIDWSIRECHQYFRREDFPEDYEEDEEEE